MNILSVKPEFGTNYDVGYVGFTYNSQSIISNGIAYFEHWSAMKDIKVSHVLVVAGEDLTIEALPEGVVYGSLKHYFDDPHTQIFFRKPVGWNREIGRELVQECAKYIGEKYGYSLIVAHALSNSLVGHFINKLFKGAPDRWVSRLLDARRQKICSELLVTAMKSFPMWAQHLPHPANVYDPKELLLSPVFKRWKTQLG